MAKQGTRKQLTPKQMALALALCLAIAAFQ